jgi:hypothetical protein
MRSHRAMGFQAVVVLLSAGAVLGVQGAAAISTPYPATIEYQQTITRILERADVRWGGVPADDYVDFRFVTASRDGSRVFFNVACPYCPAEAGYIHRPFIAGGDGSGLTDVSSIFPADLVSASWGWGNMRINDDGSRLFIKALGGSGNFTLYTRDNHSGQTTKACSNEFYPAAFDWFSIDGAGDHLYLGKYDTGWDEGLQRYRRGLYHAVRGGPYQWYLDINQLPCNQQCGNLNMLAYMGNATDTPRTFFLWNSGQAGNICGGADCLHNALWYAGLDGNAARVTNEEHYWVRDADWRGISRGDGKQVLYLYRHLPGDPQRLYLVDIPTGGQRLLSWTSQGNGYPDYFLTPSGAYAFARGGNGDAGYHYITRFDLANGGMRDTWSYWLNWADYLSNVAEDRYYFATRKDTLYRIDMAPAAPGGYASDAPRVVAAAFSDLALVDDYDRQIGVAVQVSDPQGLANIETVRLLVLVDGLEEPAFAMGREPLAFPTGDAGSTLLYDDGSHGDASAGDGWYSFDAIATRKGDYEGMNTWYQHFPLPHEVGLRILVKDRDGNYGIGDTRLLITDEPCASTALELSRQTLTGKRTLCSASAIQLGPDLVVAPGGDLYAKAPSVRLLPHTRIEVGARARIGP